MRRFFYYNSASVSSVPLLLDFYPAAAAYSVRKLRTAYTGACMRVRRSSDNTEQDIGFVSGELDTTALLSFVGAGNGFVVTWYDQAGSSNVTRAVVATQQPKIVSSGVIEVKNAKPTVLFDGSDDRLALGAGLSAFNAGNSYSVFSLVHSNVLNTLRSFQQSTGVASSNQYRGLFDNRNIASPLSFYIINSAGTVFSAGLSGTWNSTNQILLVHSMESGTNMKAFNNGNAGGTATLTGTYNNTEFTLGWGANGTINGGMQEHIVFDTDQLANRTAIETDINTYYNAY
jgi:hypothetical protein